ncbi:801_t:CDS:2, partial [Dentiscutata erythropus]
ILIFFDVEPQTRILQVLTLNMPAWRTYFTNVPPTVKTLTFSIVFVSALGALKRFHRWTENPFATNVLPNFALVPGHAIQNFWTFFTAGFLETNPASLIGSIIAMVACGKYLERAWGSKDFLKFVGIILIGVTLSTYFTYLLEYVITGDEHYLYEYKFILDLHYRFEVEANGMIGVICGFLVALKQLVPEHLVRIPLSIRIKHFPGIFVIWSFAYFLIFDAQSQFLFVIYGWLISWTYIRFFKMQDGLRGDRSETFSMASFFPEFIQPPIKIISKLVFNILVLLRCCKPIKKRRFALDLESSFHVSAPPMPGSARAEAERRRALALKALDKRLHSTNNKPNYNPAFPFPFLSPDSKRSTGETTQISTTNNNSKTPNDSSSNFGSVTPGVSSDPVLFDVKEHLDEKDL